MAYFAAVENYRPTIEEIDQPKQGQSDPTASQACDWSLALDMFCMVFSNIKVNKLPLMCLTSLSVF